MCLVKFLQMSRMNYWCTLFVLFYGNTNTYRKLFRQMIIELIKRLLESEKQRIDPIKTQQMFITDG